MANIKTLVELSSLHNAKEAVTDKFGIQKTQQPFFMTISIVEPVIGGDTNGDGQINDLDIVKQIGKQVTNLATNIVGNSNIDNSVGNINSPVGTYNSLSANSSKANGARSNVATKPTVELALPMPLELNYNEGANWADDNSAATDLALAAGAQIPKIFGSKAGGSVISGLLDAVSAQSMLSAAKKVGQKKLGIGLEPRKEMFYNGPEFRDFTFTWEFAPNNSTEALAIRDTINLLRKHKSPDRISEIGTAIGFEVWKLPSTFLISFRHGSRENSFIPKIKPCVVTSISTNLMKDGNWRSYEDGAPISTTLSISFKEVEVITQKDIKDGY